MAWAAFPPISRFPDFPIFRPPSRFPAFPLCCRPSPFSLLLAPSIACCLGVAGPAILDPGVYLEFPADPWMHYSRINEWSVATDSRRTLSLVQIQLLSRLQLSWPNFAAHPPALLARFLLHGCCLCSVGSSTGWRGQSDSAKRPSIAVCNSAGGAVSGTTSLGFFRYYGNLQQHFRARSER